ncbi:hypothetical protein MYAER_1427 [Microcystis aeruginosa NIES-2549]|uniref:Uncharacterized protein n=1 Tax=Microcystis aeruginosa NIES-2549 TaxID=1641812 RepID=A0A0F6RKU8_MICAE|nr:hypothetical protein MYAER_1427 [Microcystis aeruginosa NIES-2549]
MSGFSYRPKSQLFSSVKLFKLLLTFDFFVVFMLGINQ